MPRFAWSIRISTKNHSKTSQNWKACFDWRSLVGFHTKPFKSGSKLKRLPRFSWSGTILYIIEPFKKDSKLKRLLQFAWSSRISYKTIQKWVKFEKVASIWRGLVGFHRKTIQKWVKIEKVPSICVVCQYDFISKTIQKRVKFEKVASIGMI